MINTVSYLDSNKAPKETRYVIVCSVYWNKQISRLTQFISAQRRNFSLQENKTKQKNSPRYIIIVSNSLVLIGFNR